LLKSELDIWIIASCEATPVRYNCAKLMTCSGLPVSSIRALSYKSRATKYERLLSIASIMGTLVALISTCSQHASGSWDTLVHGSVISAISANQVWRFRSDHDCLNTATGRSSSAALPTAAFIIFDFFVGMVQSDGSSPAFMPAILMPILLLGAGRGWARVTIHNVVAALRGFFRYGAQEGWCPQHLAETIQGPRIYAQERLPAGPTWVDVERLFAGLDVNRSTDVRDRAILMLFAIYGLRESEVAKLQLDDIDWEHDQLRIPRAKRREAQVYPLLPSVGRAPPITCCRSADRRRIVRYF
jgi:Phage integrase family